MPLVTDPVNWIFSLKISHNIDPVCGKICRQNILSDDFFCHKQAQYSSSYIYHRNRLICIVYFRKLSCFLGCLFQIIIFFFAGVDAIKNVMSRQRFENIGRYLHVSDNATAIPRGQAGHDALHKVRPALSEVGLSWPRYYRPGKNLAIDEAMVAFQGRSHLKQYLPNKPTKWGIKVWMIADSETGYVCDARVYQGRGGGTANGLGWDVVTDLAERYMWQYRHLYFDNLFSSIPLMQHLLANGTYACGTLRANRKYIPAPIKNPGRLERGQSIKRQCGNLVITVWKDRKEVRMISTNVNPTDGSTMRRVGRDRVEVACPHSVLEYNKYMGGVDRADQMRSYYDIGMRSPKYWKYIFWFIMDTSINNAFILRAKSQPRPITKAESRFSNIDFRLALARQLIGGYTSRKRAGRKLVEPPVLAKHVRTDHKLVKGDKKLVCLQCKKNGKKTLKNRAVVSTFQCMQCKVALCKEDCFLRYHDYRNE